MKVLHLDANGNPVPIFSPGDSTTNATLVVNGSSASSKSAVISDTEITTVQIVADDDCHLAFGADPTATTSTYFLPGNQIIELAIKPGHKISVLGAKAWITRHVS